MSVLSTSKDEPCEWYGCKYLAEWNIYPRRRSAALAVSLCDDHHDAAVEAKAPKQELHNAASQLVRNSIGGKK